MDRPDAVDVHASPRVRNARRRYVLASWVAAVVLGIAVLATLVVVIISQQRLVDIAKGNRANGDAIRSCTTPGGQCYERSRAQTATVVGQLITAIQRNDQRAAQRATAQLQAIASVCHQLEAAHVVRTCEAQR